MAQFLLCSEEMITESPCAADDARLAAKVRRERQISSQLTTAMTSPLFGFPDPKLLNDPRVLQNMLQVEALTVGKGQLEPPKYFDTIQTDISPSMRRTVAFWLFEVCEEQKMEGSVFLRTLQQLDAFLGKIRITRCQYQLVAAVCLLISSKLAGTLIPARILTYYTAGGVTKEELLQWEGMVLSTLGWDVCDPVSMDFVPYIVNQLPTSLKGDEGARGRIKLYISFSATDLELMVYPPSLIAAGAIGAALAPPFIGPKAFEEALITISKVTQTKMRHLQECIQKIKWAVEGYCNNRKAGRWGEEGFASNRASDPAA